MSALLVDRREISGALALLFPSSNLLTLRAAGARGNGITDDTGALALALGRGTVVNGEGRTYGVSGNLIVGSRFAGLVNAKLRQISPRGPQRRTLVVQNATKFVIENVDIDRGGDGSEVVDPNQMLDHAGLYLEECSNFALSDISVTGGGIGCGISINGCSDFSTTRIRASNIQYRLTRHPSNDAMQGIYFFNCSRFICDSCSVKALGGSDGTTHIHDNGRGFAFGSCSVFRVRNCSSHYVGQGFDLTGTTGNRDFQLSQNDAGDCATWGIKCANSAQDGIVEDSRATRCGIGGFVVSGPTEELNPRPARISFSRCTAQNLLDLRQGTTSFGFGVTNVRTIDPSYPRDIHFESCLAIGRPSVSRMEYGFLNDIPAALTAGHPNWVKNCKAVGYLTAAFVGFG